MENKDQKHSPNYKAILSVIKDNYKNQKFKAPQIAETLNISLSTLQRKLKAEKQITLSQLIYQYRIDQAKKMIEQNIPITVVAQNCGFGSSSHFSTKFKAITGQTPTQYIQNQKRNAKDAKKA